MTRKFHLLEEKTLAEGLDGEPEKVWQEVGRFRSFEAASQAVKYLGVDVVVWCVQSLDGTLRTWGAWGHGQAVRYDNGRWTPAVMEGRRLIPLVEDERLSEWQRREMQKIRGPKVYERIGQEIERKEETEVGVVQKRLVVAESRRNKVGEGFWGYIECNDGRDYWRRAETEPRETVEAVLAEIANNLGTGGQD